MSFPENSRRLFPAPPLAPLLGKANAGKVVSVHYWPQLKSEDQWTPVWINVTSCFRVLWLLQRVQHRVLLLEENTAVAVPPRSNPSSSSHIVWSNPGPCAVWLRIQPNSPPFEVKAWKPSNGWQQVKGEPLKATTQIFHIKISKSCRHPTRVVHKRHILEYVCHSLSQLWTTGNGNTNEWASKNLHCNRVKNPSRYSLNLKAVRWHQCI